MEVLKSLGVGKECVYVYYYPNDRLLAEAIGAKSWECKIGMTTGDVVERISSQGLKTSRHQAPVIALKIRTDNAVGLESKLHRIFYAERINTDKIIGDEWFMINPQQIEDYYNSENHHSGTKLIVNDPCIIEDPQSLGRVVKKLRKHLKLRQEDLGVSRMTVTRIENNSGPIQTDSLFELVDKLGCRLVMVPKDRL